MKKFFLRFWILSILLISTSASALISGYSEKETEKITHLSLDTALQDTPKKAKISVGPNILVSRDGDVPHVELTIASNPKNTRNLLGAAIAFTRPEGNFACKTYTSMDGGYTWTDTIFPEQIKFGGVDPQVAFGLHGTAYFAALAMRKGLYVYRSEDGGKTWQKPCLLRSCDHPQIIVDQSLGKYAGRIYIGAMYTFPKWPYYTVGVFRSDDDAKTFIGPVPAASGGGKIGINVANMLIFSDRTLFVPYVDFAIDPEKRKTTKTSTNWFVTSSDGGVSFSAPAKINSRYIKEPAERVKDFGSEKNFVRGRMPVYALDTHSKKYRDRLYMAWDDYRFGNSQILFSYSSDRGKTWSDPVQVNPEIPDWASQYQPMMVINNQGIVGIIWFDTRGSKQQDRYHLYFSASVDGGETFLPPVQVSSEPSFPAGMVNLTPVPVSFGEGREESITVRTHSAFVRWPHGGDYIGMTTDSRGLFRPFWADSRSGTFQAWTSQIRVIIEDEKETQKDTASVEKVKKSLNQHIDFIFDPVKYDPETKVIVIPIRLKNVSSETLFGPFFLKVKRLSDPNIIKRGLKFRLNIPQILNASNGKTDVGAVFDYSSALRDFESLEPGALSEAVEWKLKSSKPTPTPLYMEVEVMGFVLQKK